MANMNKFELNKIYRVIPYQERKKRKYQSTHHGFYPLKKPPYMCSDVKVYDGDGVLKEIIPVTSLSIRKAKKKNLVKIFQKELAENPTTYEKLLKRKLKEIAIKNGLTCLFQHPINFPGFFFILDFYFTQIKLCVEVDGVQHQEPKQAQYDLERTRCLEKGGIKVLRFSNLEVKNSLPSVCLHVEQIVSQRKMLNPELVEQTKRVTRIAKPQLAG